MNIDVNKPVENPLLKSILEELCKADKESFPKLMEKAAAEIAENAALLAVIKLNTEDIEDNGNGIAVFKKESKMAFGMLTAPDGVPYLPVYTDWTELRKAEQNKGEVKTLILRFDDMAAICKGDSGIVINPYSHNFVLTPKNVVHMKQYKDALKQGFSEEVVKKATQVQIGEPSQYPTDMVNAILKKAKVNKDINAIWLKLMVKEGEKSYLLIVDFTGDYRRVFSYIGESAKPYLNNGMHLDMVPFADSFGQQAASGEPFYRRKRGLFGK